MKRKIIKQGHNTLTLTLPNAWVKKLNLKGGDEIDIVECENSLLINAKENSAPKHFEIDIRNFSVPLLWRYFQGAYRSGCDEIKIYFDPAKREYEDAYHYYTSQFEYARLGEKIPPKPAIAMIQEVTNRFIGVDVVETGKNYCLVKEMAEVTVKEFENSLRRIFLSILQIFDRIMESIEKNQINTPSLCKEIHTMDLTIDKLVDYCARILSKISGQIPDRKKPTIFSSLFILELLGDEFKYIGKHIALSKKPIKDILKMTKMIKEHFELYYRLYYSFSRENTMALGDHDTKIYGYFYSAKNSIRGESRSILAHLMNISKYVLVLAELRIQQELE